MLSSIRYTSKSKLALSTSTLIPNKLIILQIVLTKILVLATLFTSPSLLPENTVCTIIVVLVAFDFWVSKNLGRKYVNACWYVDTSQKEDEWVYEAGLKSVEEEFEAIFWYSFILYGALLFVFVVLSLTIGKLSLLCAVLIGCVSNYINFYAFSTIIELRNEGILQMIS